MKTIAYSEVPQTHTYVHLAYLSASSWRATDTGLVTGLLAELFLLSALAAGRRSKFAREFPGAWRLCSVAFVTTAVFLLVFACLAHFSIAKTRGM